MQEIAALDLIVKLCRTLAEKQIDYCHWKSNVALDRSARGDNDLDLLVNRRDAQCFTQILTGLGFKETIAPQSERLPGVTDYYGYDRSSGRLVHVHAHYQLVFGSDLSKNYRLPVEKAYLFSSSQKGLFRIPSPEFELMILVIRLVLKHSTWDSILMRHGQLSASERCELDDLSVENTFSKVDEVLHHIPGLNRSLFDLCLQSLKPGCPYLTRIKAGELLQRAIQVHARYPHWFDIILKFARRIWQPFLQRGFRYMPKNCFSNGGLFIAFVGGDGAGKTTAIEEIYKWLSGTFEVKRFHMGKPVWSWMTTMIRGMLKVGTLMRLYSFEGDVYEDVSKPHGYPWFVRAVCTAYDRYLTYMCAHRFSSNGGLVLCDRYSFPGFMKMDGPQCEDAITVLGKTNWFLEFLAHMEKHYYQKIKLPDLLIVLKVDSETAVRRKVDETAMSVRARSVEVESLNWEELSAFVVNANRSREDALSQIKSLVWEHL